MSKVMMIGFDGADPCVVKQLLDEGRLPNFKKVIENGTTTKDYSQHTQYDTAASKSNGIGVKYVCFR